MSLIEFHDRVVILVLTGRDSRGVWSMAVKEPGFRAIVKNGHLSEAEMNMISMMSRAAADPELDMAGKKLQEFFLHYIRCAQELDLEEFRKTIQSHFYALVYLCAAGETKLVFGLEERAYQDLAESIFMGAKSGGGWQVVKDQAFVNKELATIGCFSMLMYDSY